MTRRPTGAGVMRSVRNVWRVCHGVALMSLLLTLGTVAAGPPPWTEAPYSHYANSARLDTVLKDFAGSFSLSLKLGGGIEGGVNGRFNAASPTDFINKLGSVYGFNWFIHAGTLFVSRSDDQRVAYLPSAYNSTGQLRDALASLGILDARFGWGELPDQGVAMVSGPPAYVDLIERTVKSLPSVAGGQQVAVFRLKHASVDDRSIFFRDREIVTPGVATILRNLILGAGGGGRGGVNNEAMASAAPLRTASPLVADPAAAASATVAAPTASPIRTPGGARVRMPSVQADVRLNSLIVQDIPERMPVYETLIRALDVPTPLIEIQAMIVDVNSQYMSELGIDWGARVGRGGLGYNTPTPASSSPALAINWAAAKDAVDASTLSVSAGNFLVSRLRALEGIGDATVQSRRSVLTLDNLGAVFDHSETFYIRTQGERVATVTPVSAGTTLRVTPRVIRSDDRSVVQLTVDVEDGAVQDKLVDQLPTVLNSGLSTQALVNEGQTLIVGGYSREQDVQRTDRVPVLGAIPVLGLLFSHKTTDRQQRQRLFLIKPRVVALPAGESIVIPDEASADVPAFAMPEAQEKKAP
ncbi:type III secretion system outer membrane ring subunit SctC [Propionivibrio dicarboxylicus]|uniref:Type 3 secretion system secretin n=1 Tax=Propionivibrio dicarboxylicus TaxID=83767 RepID=A0A1G7WTR3_9RHOO|nr:type III secretion system outer membrane ring subunit SctC [Propionivibrio dicarboxylicus]SDG75303.1 type III secretion protein C [Propionivibrio dicarboxylicus]